MHRSSESESALATSAPLPWGDLLGRMMVCLGCLVAGGTLVALATPTSRVAAGAASGRANASLPETVLLDFTATWCGPCQQMSPIIDKLAEQGYPVRKIDVDRERAVAERFGVTAMPTFVLLVNGREVMRQTGATSEGQLRRMVQQIPEWERELAEQGRRRQPETKVTDRGSNPSLTIPVDLGTPQPALDESFALAPTEPPKGNTKPRFGMPSLFGRGKEKPQAPAEPAVIRGNTPDSERIVMALPHDPLSASVRLRVKDLTGINFGSGTIIDLRAGQALILTCGHIFRNVEKDGTVEVDVFDVDRQSYQFVGKIVKYDLASDVGLVLINTDAALSSVGLARLTAPLTTGEKVVSIGCGGGDLPSKEELAVTAVNRYDGPDNIECTGLPVQGRSGGGLFRGNTVVGVCIAADPDNRRGVYAALKPIHGLIEAAGYGHVLRGGPPAMNSALVETTPATVQPKSVPLPSAQDEFAEAMVQAAQTAGVATSPTDSLRKAVEQSPDAEIIVIVRPKNSAAPSRVVVVNQASSKLLSYLMDDVGGTGATPAARDTALTRSETLIPTTVTAPASKRPPVSPRRP